MSSARGFTSKPHPRSLDDKYCLGVVGTRRIGGTVCVNTVADVVCQYSLCHSPRDDDKTFHLSQIL